MGDRRRQFPKRRQTAGARQFIPGAFKAAFGGAAVVDVRTGRGELLVPEAFSDSRSSSLIDREESDQDQVELLKDLAYADAAAFLMERCGS